MVFASTWPETSGRDDYHASPIVVNVHVAYTVKAEAFLAGLMCDEIILHLNAMSLQIGD